jgi:hypothetical protein
VAIEGIEVVDAISRRGSQTRPLGAADQFGPVINSSVRMKCPGGRAMEPLSVRIMAETAPSMVRFPLKYTGILQNE